MTPAGESVGELLVQAAREGRVVVDDSRPVPTMPRLVAKPVDLVNTPRRQPIVEGQVVKAGDGATYRLVNVTGNTYTARLEIPKTRGKAAAKQRKRERRRARLEREADLTKSSLLNSEASR